MTSLKEIFKSHKKEEIYNYYQRFNSTPKEYSKITREEMYKYIYDVFRQNPEVITQMGTIEEVNILKRLIAEEPVRPTNGYLDYLLLNNLKENYLIYEENNQYYIPTDIFNFVKMALNIYNEQEYTYHDISDSVIIGLIRMHNVLTLNNFLEYLKKYNIILDAKTCKSYINNNMRLNKLIAIIKYQKQDYIISLEFNYYKDVLNLSQNNLPRPPYTLEEMISMGKYNLNLFKEEIFNFLGFLESHLEPQIIKLFLNDLYVYAGFDINNNEALNNIAGNIPELYKEVLLVINSFPCWIYNGNSIKELDMLEKAVKESLKDSSISNKPKFFTKLKKSFKSLFDKFF